MNFGEKSVSAREENGGLLDTHLKFPITSLDELATYYSPGIAEPCRRIAADQNLSKKLTIRRNTVAVISDGSAVLGLGNIGPEAALPVMEGKCMLLKQFGGVDAFPIVLATQDPDEIVETVARLAPTFGGINLEDISAPRCFDVEERLSAMLDIPVFHDDQHGTAIVVLAAMKNALRVVEKKLADVHIVISGAGAAGVAIDKLLRAAGAAHVEMADSKGMVSCTRGDLNDHKRELCSLREGALSDGVREADVFIGVSKPNVLTAEMVRSMARDPLIFAMANPDPEILPNVAHAAGAAIVATGRSDFPNQINNVLVFPGLFRGLLDAGITHVTTEMKLAAADALAALVPDPTTEKIIPTPLEPDVADAIAVAIKKFAE